MLNPPYVIASSQQCFPGVLATSTNMSVPSLKVSNFISASPTPLA